MALALTTLLIAMLAPFPAARAASDSLGADFWLAFPGNYNDSPTLSLFITGDTATSGTVAVPGIGFSAPFTVTPGAVSTVVVPTAANISTSDVVENKGIHVTALAEVTVYGISRMTATTDAYLGLPTDILGTEYVVLGYKNSNVVNATEFAVVGTQNDTSVTITPSVATGARPAGIPYTVTMDQGDTYQLRNTNAAPADLSGTIVKSDKPIAVFGGHGCANIPPGAVACDHIVEELFPTATWGKAFVTMPLATRTNGDTFRYIAATNGTHVSVNGTVVATLNRGQLFEQIVTGPAHITADQPIMVAQYSNGSSFDGVTSDPFQMLVPPYEQFLGGYTVTTPASGFSKNFINVVVPNAAIGSITVDAVPVPAASYTAIGASGFSGVQLPVGVGAHNVRATSPTPFGVFVYGFDNYDSYGYPGGLSLAPVARVASVTLAPKTAVNPIGTQHCVTATVLDQSANPLAGIRVDFGVTGVNPTTGFANTAANGTAQFCYTGANTGNDNILASVGTLSDTATKTWIGQNSISIGDVTVAEGDSGLAPATQATFTVSLDHPAAAGGVTVLASTAAGSATSPADYLAQAGTVVSFSEGQQTRPFTVQVRGDVINEPNESFLVNLSSPGNATILDGQGVGTIIDDDRNGTFSCRASALRLVGTETAVANGPGTPCIDDSQTVRSADLTSGLVNVSSGTLRATTDQTPDDLETTAPAASDNGLAVATVQRATVAALSLMGISTTDVQSQARVQCTNILGVLTPTFTSSSTIGSLQVNGANINVNGSVTMSLPLGLGFVQTNRTVSTATTVTQQAVRVVLLGLEVVIGEAKAGFTGNPCAQ